MSKHYVIVPKDERAEKGTVFARGNNHNIWRHDEEFETDFEVLSKAEAQLKCLRWSSGTPTEDEVENIRERMMDILGVDIMEVEVEDLGVSYYKYLVDHRPSYPERHYKYKNPKTTILDREEDG